MEQNKDTLFQGEGLKCGQFIQSQNGFYKATLQEDGNFVIYLVDNGSETPLWASGHQLIGYDDNMVLTLQSDGNLVQYILSTREVIWEAQSYIYASNAVQPFRLNIDNSGCLTIYDALNIQVWSQPPNSDNQQQTKEIIDKIKNEANSLNKIQSSGNDQKQKLEEIQQMLNQLIATQKNKTN